MQQPSARLGADQELANFSTRFGERSNKDTDGQSGLRLRGKLEHSKQVHVPLASAEVAVVVKTKGSKFGW